MEYFDKPENINLHELYVEWAIEHLVIINKFIEDINEFSNINLMDIQITIWHERAKLIEQNPVYRDAAAFIMAGHTRETFAQNTGNVDDEEVIEQSMMGNEPFPL